MTNGMVCPVCKIEGNVFGPLSLLNCVEHGFYTAEGFENQALVDAWNNMVKE